MIVSKMLFLVLPGIFGLLGLLCYYFAVQKPMARDNIKKPSIPGKSRKGRYVYIAFVLWILGLLILLKSLIRL